MPCLCKRLGMKNPRWCLQRPWHWRALKLQLRSQDCTVVKSKRYCVVDNTFFRSNSSV